MGLLGALRSSRALPRLTLLQLGREGWQLERGQERAGFVWFFKRETQESAFLVHFVLVFFTETKQTRLAHS